MAARQLASRARRRVRGAGDRRDVDGIRHTTVVRAFLAATRAGDFQSLLRLLDPDVVLRADAAAVRLGASPEVRGVGGAAAFLQRARGAHPALVDGAPRAAGAAGMVGGRPRVVYSLAVCDGRIVEVELIGDEDRMRGLDLVITDPD